MGKGIGSDVYFLAFSKIKIYSLVVHYMLYRRHGGVRKEPGVKTPFQAVEKWFMLKPEIFKQNPCIFKNKILCSQSNKSPGFQKQPYGT